MSEAVNKAESFLYDKKQHYIVTPNPEILIHALKNIEFRKVLNRSGLSIPDGIGIVWASRFLNKGVIKERVTGVDFVRKFLEYLDCKNTAEDRLYRGFVRSRTYNIAVQGAGLGGDNGKCAPLKILLTGGRNGTARLSSEILGKQFPSIRFYSLENIEINRSLFVIRDIIRPDIIFTALGAPRQEMWIHKNLRKIPTAKIAMGVGGAFDFISGKVPRAPRKLQKAGVEWLWRFILQPWRLRRIFNAVVIFPLAVTKEKILRVSKGGKS